MTSPPQRESSRQAQSTRNESKRAHVTPVACESCQKRRSKVCSSLHRSIESNPRAVSADSHVPQCDGKRPRCSTCWSKGVWKCVYEPEIDGSRSKYLRQHNRDLQNEIVHLRQRLDKLPAAQLEGSPKGKFLQAPASPDSPPLSVGDEAYTSPSSDTTNSQPGQMTYEDEGTFDRYQHLSQRSVRQSRLCCPGI